MSRRAGGAGVLSALLLAVVLACKGGSPISPSPGGGGGTGSGGGGTGGGAPDQATITITSAGVVDLREVTIRQGGRVTFTNNDSRPHDMASDPHPTHEDCPPLDQVGFLNPGQSRTSGNFTIVRTCGFHDHNLPTSTGLQGRIIIVP